MSAARSEGPMTPDALRQAIERTVVDTLRSIHFDGTGCGTNGTGGCSVCYGPSPLDATEIAEHLAPAIMDAVALALEAAEAEIERLREEIQAETEREERLFVRLPFYEALRAERDALRVAVDRVRALCDGREASTPPSTDFHGNPMPALLSVTEVCAALGGETGG